MTDLEKYEYKKIDEKCDCDGRTYPLTATSYMLCIECSRQYPMGLAERNLYYGESWTLGEEE